METIVYVIIAIALVYIAFKIFKTLIKWVIIAVVIVALIAFFTNPKTEHHRDQFKAMVKDLPVAIKDDALQVKDYKVFSVVKVKKDGKEHVAGVGAFGKVWYFDDALK